MASHRNEQSLDEWELSKENVLPLKQGRKMTNLTAALQPQNVDRQQQLNLQRQSFETELRAYSGDDPLDPWVRYIQWTEQNFPQGGKDSYLKILMEKCLLQFKNDERFKQDPRFVSIWLKMAQYDSESLEIYKFMQANQIGSELAMFWESWAWEVEQVGNTKRAHAIYQEGLAANPQPRDRLERALIEFQSRIGRATVQQMQEGLLNPAGAEDQRATLGDLRARGKQVAANRIGGAKLSGRGGLQMGGAGAPLQTRGNQITVFCDADAAAPGGAASAEWKHLPTRSEAQKENMRAAGQWAGQRLPQRNMPAMSFQDAASYSKPQFVVHVDDKAEQLTTPRKPLEMGFQVLSEKKPSKPASALQHVRQDNANDNTRVMYCKPLIYGGAREMSFEELRAIKDKTKRKERELQAKLEEADRIRQDMIKQQQAQQAMFAQFQTEMEQQRLHRQQLIDLIAKQKLEGVPPHPQAAPPVAPAAALPTQASVLMAPAAVAPTSAPPAQYESTVPSRPQAAPMHHGPVPAEYPSSQAATPLLQRPAPSVPAPAPQTAPLQGVLDDCNVTKDRHRSNSGESTIACTKHLVFDDLTGATGNFNIFCDQTQDLPLKPAPQYPTTTSVTRMSPPPAVAQPISADTPAAAAVDTVTPNQSLHMNTSSARPTAAPNSENRTPQTSILSDKTPTSTSFTSSAPSSAAAMHRRGGGVTRAGRLSHIRTPRGLTAPSPTINTKEAMGVINAMLNSDLEADMFGWEGGLQPQLPSQEIDFEMEFANCDENDKPSKMGACAQDSSAFTRVGSFGQGIIPRRQPLAARSEGLSLPESAPAPAIPIYCDGVKPLSQDEKVEEPAKVQIFEDEPKENMPPSDYRQVEERREMKGVLQCSQGIPVAPPEEQYAYTEEEMEADGGVVPSVDPLATSQHRDATMNATWAPSATSFEVAARMASTPFNDTSRRELSFIPPMSNIKPREIPREPAPLTKLPMQGAAVPGGASLVQDRGVGLVGRSAIAGLAARVTQPVNESFEETENSANVSREALSVIMETSAENAQSSTSNSTSTTNSHASASSLEGSQLSALGVTPQAPAPAPPGAALGGPLSAFSIHVDKPQGAHSLTRPPSEVSQSVLQPQAKFTIYADNEQQQDQSGLHSAPLPDISAAECSLREMSLHSTSRPQTQHQPQNQTQPQPQNQTQPQPQTQTQPQPDRPKDGFLHKDDLPELEMSFIPDRTLQDTSQVEEDLTTYGLLSDQDQPLDYSDPFNAGLQNLLLTRLNKPLHLYKGYYQIAQQMPAIKPGLAVNFGDEINVYKVNKKLGEGAFASIYLAACLDAQDMADLDSEFSQVALKVQHPPCPWEFYIVKELHARLSRLPSQVDVRPSLMSASCAHVYNDSSCLVTEYHSNGNLLDLINSNKALNKTNLCEPLVLYLSIEILQVVEFMHRCHIIHGDIKPDNFLIANSDNSDDVTCSQNVASLVKLIDMGRSIDMTLFPEGTVFTAKCKTSGFNCTEMQSNRPWTYQVDYYGIAGTIHCMLFGTYMKVYQEQGVWKTTSKPSRRSSVDWKGIFHTLLNVPSCDPSDLPSLADLRKQLETHVNPEEKGEIKMNIELLLAEARGDL